MTPPPPARPDAEFVTHGNKEIAIEFTEQGMYRPHFVGGGQLPEALDQSFTSRARAVQAIVLYLRGDDVRGVAVWPGKGK